MKLRLSLIFLLLVSCENKDATYSEKMISTTQGNQAVMNVEKEVRLYNYEVKLMRSELNDLKNKDGVITVTQTDKNTYWVTTDQRFNDLEKQKNKN